MQNYIPDITKEEIENKIQTSIGILFKKDAFLLLHAAHERSVTHKLAEYLQKEFPDYHVDCEYNKHSKEVKKLLRKCSEKELEKRTCGKSSDRIYPDIVVHIRGNDGKNLLVIEAKIKVRNETKKTKKIEKCDIGPSET